MITASATTVSGQARRATGSADEAPKSAPEASKPAVKLLRVGSSGADVLALKQALRGMSFLIVEGRSERAVYNQATADAVMAFQKLNGLERDGVAGPNTRRAMATPAKPRLASGGASDRVEVDKSQQLLYMVRGGQVKYIVNTSTGNGVGGIITPSGTFSVYEKRGAVDPGPSGPLFWPSYFRGGVAVHGSNSVPGYPASHGCVRIPRTTEYHVYKDMPLRSQVVVHE